MSERFFSLYNSFYQTIQRYLIQPVETTSDRLKLITITDSTSEKPATKGGQDEKDFAFAMYFFRIPIVSKL